MSSVPGFQSSKSDAGDFCALALQGHNPMAADALKNALRFIVIVRVYFARWSGSSENNSAHSPLSNLTTSLALIVRMGWFLEKLPGLQQESPADDRAFLTPLKHKGGDLRCKSLSSSRLYYASSVQSRRAFGSVRALGRPSEPVSHTGSV
jgi:hypothetical protein